MKIGGEEAAARKARNRIGRKQRRGGENVVDSRDGLQVVVAGRGGSGVQEGVTSSSAGRGVWREETRERFVVGRVQVIVWLWEG